MNDIIKQIIWSQFGASVDMLENAIAACPDEIWSTGSKFQDFWYIAYHTLFFLDFYLSETPEDYLPLTPFGLTELDPEGILPERIYTKAELLSYCHHCRSKCMATIESMTEQKSDQRYKYGTVNLSFPELLLYSMRHVQHHTGQLNLILRLKADLGSVYVKQAKEKLESV